MRRKKFINGVEEFYIYKETVKNIQSTNALI